MSVSSSTVIGIAERDVGVTESPPGNNLPEHVWAGATIMLAAAGLSIARWPTR